MGENFKPGDGPVLLVKRGLYYAPDRQGYTGVKDRAGRYTVEDAEQLASSGVTAVPEYEAPLFSSACWDDVKVKFLLDRIAELEEALVAHNCGTPGCLCWILCRKHDDLDGLVRS